MFFSQTFFRRFSVEKDAISIFIGQYPTRYFQQKNTKFRIATAETDLLL